jgi:hypothetical protein
VGKIGSDPKAVLMNSPYVLETVFMPAHLEAALDRTTTSPVPPFEPLALSCDACNARFTKLRSRLLARAEQLEATYQGMVERITPEHSQHALEAHKEHEPPLLLQQYAIYDEFFGVRRGSTISAEEFECQFVRTVAGLLSDLPHAMMARDSLNQMLAGIEAALDRFPSLDQESAECPGWELADDLSVVRFRWNTGHHIYAMMNHLCGDAFCRAASLLDEPAACAEEIRRSEVFLRASSAGIEYTANFPSHFYREVIRPSMPEGFSGGQNSDYNHMKIQKGKLQAQLVLRYTRFTDRWPEEIRSAAESFREADLLDLDVHVRVAAVSVGMGQSLKQKQAQDGGINALTALRRMANPRSHDFGL